MERIKVICCEGMLNCLLTTLHRAHNFTSRKSRLAEPEYLTNLDIREVLATSSGTASIHHCGI